MCGDKKTQRRPPPVFVRIIIVPHIEAGENTNNGHSQLRHSLGLQGGSDNEGGQHTGLGRGRRRWGRCLLDRQRTLEDPDIFAPGSALVLRVLLDVPLRVLLNKLTQLVLVVSKVEAPGLTWR